MTKRDDPKPFVPELIVNGEIVAYKLQMPTVQQTETYSTWFQNLRDIRAKRKILVRVDRLAEGNPGDVAPVGDGVSEMRIHYGPGYRVYYVKRGADLILLLCGGDKDSQQRDIEAARRMAQQEQRS